MDEQEIFSDPAAAQRVASEDCFTFASTHAHAHARVHSLLEADV